MGERQFKRTWLGWRAGGLTVGGRIWTETKGYIYTIANWHNPKHQCWLWVLNANRIKPEWGQRRVGYWHIPGPQSRRIIGLYWIEFMFTWQAEGWYRGVREWRTAALLKRLGIKKITPPRQEMPHD